MNKLFRHAVTLQDPIAEIVIRDIRHVSSSTSLNELSRILVRTRYALVDRKSLVTADDLLAFIAQKRNQDKSNLPDQA